MENDAREAIALFRYGLIAPILNGQVDPQDYLAKTACLKHDVPGGGLREYTPKTIRAWVLAYRREGFEGLKPKNRKDRGQPRKFTREEEEHIIAIRNEHRSIPITVFYDQLVEKGELLPADVSYSTVYRLLKANGLAGKSIASAAERKRFAYDTVNMLWQGDFSYGPYLTIDGRKKQTFLFAFIDDCSRLVPSAGFFLTENIDPLKQVFTDAVLRRGLPRIVYVDNGKIYRSDVFQIAYATLGISLSHTQPYDAAAKGKIERFFKTVRTRFYPLLGMELANNLEELNQRFWKWLEEDYHRRPHSSLGEKSPLDVWQSQASKVRMLEDTSILTNLFLKRDKRKVRHDGTISVGAKLYEVPAKFIGRQIEVRFDESAVFIYEDGLQVEQARLVNFKDNAHAKRTKTLTMRNLKEGDSDV